MTDQVEEVKSKVDIVEVISSYVPLKKMGRNLGGLCPFHSERTPSFMVSPERQSFKCFGCGEGGDVFTFLEKVEGWEFREVLEELAKRAGVKLVNQGLSRGSKVREKLININNLTAKFYSHILNNHKLGEIARKYLLGRGVGEDLWKKFDLGYSPEGWENTFNFLTKRGFDASDIALSGLVIGREGGRVGKSSFYDRFRGRVMFPIKDSRGTVLGFSGRLLKEKEAPLRPGFAGQAKYINSPETPIFTKGSMLFGLDVARNVIRDKGEVLLVEGEFDVISAHKAGLANVVASKGTALTEKQVATISRLCENVALCFDMDLAGDAAARRGIELLDMAGLNIKVVRLPGVKDPDEFAQKDPRGFVSAVEKSQNVYDYLIESAISRHGATTAEGKKKVGREILPVLSKISDDLVRAHFITKFAKLLDLEVGFVNDAVEKKSNIVGPPTVGGEISIETVKSQPESNVLEDYFLALFLAGGPIYHKVLDKLEPTDFENEEARAFWKDARDIISDSKFVKTGDFLKRIPEKFAKFVDHLYFINISPSVLEKEQWAQEILKVAARIKKKSLKAQVEEVSSQLKEAQRLSEQGKIKSLVLKFDRISQLLEAEDKQL